jgi:hypothetical protein
MPPRRTTRDDRPVSRRADDEDREPYDEEEPDIDEAGDVDAGEDADPEPDEDESSQPARRRRGAPRRVTAAQAAQAGLRSLTELIGKKPEGVTAVEPTDDGWLVGVEVIEDQRVPSSADILAVYEAELDPDGDLVSYRRTARYPRGRGDSSRES